MPTVIYVGPEAIPAHVGLQLDEWGTTHAILHTEAGVIEHPLPDDLTALLVYDREVSVQFQRDCPWPIYDLGQGGLLLSPGVDNPEEPAPSESEDPPSAVLPAPLPAVDPAAQAAGDEDLQSNEPRLIEEPLQVKTSNNSAQSQLPDGITPSDLAVWARVNAALYKFHDISPVDPSI